MEKNYTKLVEKINSDSPWKEARILRDNIILCEFRNFGKITLTVRDEDVEVKLNENNRDYIRLMSVESSESIDGWDRLFQVLLSTAMIIKRDDIKSFRRYEVELVTLDDLSFVRGVLGNVGDEIDTSPENFKPGIFRFNYDTNSWVLSEYKETLESMYRLTSVSYFKTVIEKDPYVALSKAKSMGLCKIETANRILLIDSSHLSYDYFQNQIFASIHGKYYPAQIIF